MSGVGVVAFQARASKVFYRCSAAAQYDEVAPKE